MEEENVEEILRDLFYSKLDFERNLKEILKSIYIRNECGFIQLWVD